MKPARNATRLALQRRGPYIQPFTHEDTRMIRADLIDTTLSVSAAAEAADVYSRMRPRL